MVPLIGFIVLVIDLYIWVVIAGAILSWLIAFNVVNTNNRFVYQVADMLYRRDRAGTSPDQEHLAQSRRYRHFASYPDPVPAVHPRRGPARLDPATLRADGRSLSGTSLKLKLRRVYAGIMLAVWLTPKSGRD